MEPKLSIAYFVTSHGFGHAARSCAVMNAVHARWPYVHFDIYTETPEWFFGNSLAASHAYHPEQTDVGLVQTSALHFSMEKTLDALGAFLPLNPDRLGRLADEIHARQCHMVISDISPLGLAVAKEAGLPSVLVENFTWDWIYEVYVETDQRFSRYIDILSGIFSQAGLRVQTTPVCRTDNGHPCTPPVARASTSDPGSVRERLGVGENEKMVLITMGGVSGELPFIDQLAGMDGNTCFVVPGTAPDLPLTGARRNNVVLLPQNAAFHHPDLVRAADAVVGKVGYSTLAEVWQAGVPFGYISRADFSESPVLESYIRRKMTGMPIPEPAFNSGSWLNALPGLLELRGEPVNEPNGADMAAEYICNYLACEKEILEVVDAGGRIIGAAPRKSVHGNNCLLHRVVHVLVCDKDGRLLLQKRSLDKRVAPGKWDTSVGGHVDCGESIEAAMYREMAEELGIRPASLRFAYQYTHSNDFESELVFTYTCQYEGPIVFNPVEIDAVRYWGPGEIEESLGKGILSDNFEDEFRRYREWLKMEKGGG